MATIPFATHESAATRSRELWTAVLGRTKYAQDVTEYLYGVTVRSDDLVQPLPDGVDVALVVHERDDYLDTLLRADQMTEAELGALVGLYPTWSAGITYSVGDLMAYSGKLYRVVQAHTSQSDWTPDIVPALFTPVAPAGVIPAWVQPLGAHDAYALDALVTHNGRTWISLMAANTYEPSVIGSWRDQTVPPMWVAPVGSIGLWQTGDIVTHVGQVWRSAINNNTTEPNQPPRSRWTVE